jgi:hypothetical protein
MFLMRRRKRNADQADNRSADSSFAEDRSTLERSRSSSVAASAFLRRSINGGVSAAGMGL